MYRGRYFKNIQSNVTNKLLIDSWKEFGHMIDAIDPKHFISTFYDMLINKYDVACGTSLWFWEDKGCINSIGPHGWFQWYCRYWLGGIFFDNKI